MKNFIISIFCSGKYSHTIQVPNQQGNNWGLIPGHLGEKGDALPVTTEPSVDWILYDIIETENICNSFEFQLMQHGFCKSTRRVKILDRTS